MAKEPLHFNYKWCKACGICIAFCPVKALEERKEDNKPHLPDPEKCTRCGLCELRCPDFAVLVRREDEQ